MDIAASLDQDACYRAVTTRDLGFDGRFFGCVKTTGIYCRPVCPARTPRRENMVFVRSAAEAETLGFRACLRCRPETAPDMGAWRGSSNTVSRALALIEAGALDSGDTEALANRLGVGDRQLRRLFRKHLGAAPVSVAQTRRVLLAKQLIHDTDLSMAEVALASGFGSVRRFNETFQELYGRPPSELRRRRVVEAAPGEALRLRLPFRSPYDWAAMLTALTERAAADETVADSRWTRLLRPDIDGCEGCVTVQPVAGDRVEVEARVDDLKALPGVLARVRRVLDLGADPQAIAADLSSDAALGPAIRAHPGLRPPGDWVNAGDDAPGDRLSDADAALAERAERWRPWRAYGALYWKTTETRDEKAA